MFFLYLEKINTQLFENLLDYKCEIYIQSSFNRGNRHASRQPVFHYSLLSLNEKDCSLIRREVIW